MYFLRTFSFGSGFYNLWIYSEITNTYHYYSALAEEFNCLITLGILPPFTIQSQGALPSILISSSLSLHDVEMYARAH